MNIKFLVPIILSILIGFLFGNIIFRNYTNDVSAAFKENETAYFVQYGAYISNDKMKEATQLLTKYIYEYDNEYYRVYIGITKDKENLEKIKDFYKDVTNDIYVKEISINKKTADFLVNSDQLLKIATDKTTIKKIIMETLEKYEETSSE